MKISCHSAARLSQYIGGQELEIHTRNPVIPVILVARRKPTQLVRCLSGALIQCSQALSCGGAANLGGQLTKQLRRKISVDFLSPPPRRHQYKLKADEAGKPNDNGQRRGSTVVQAVFDRIKRIFELKELPNEANKGSFRSS